ncbi:MAG: imidazole glycerol phosphate synthase subunit HisH [Bacteroidota bacterium]
MIAIIKYGAGNTRSVMNALDRLNVNYELTDIPETIIAAEKVIFPGVGHAKHAMNVLKSKGLDEVIRSVTNPLLGICVGMQLLYEYSEEGDTECLGLIEGSIVKFDENLLIVPQIGWNTITHNGGPLFSDLEESPWFYAVHSYYARKGENTIATSTYGVEYCSAVQKDNFYGAQFHPEKSSSNGHQLLKNFIEL